MSVFDLDEDAMSGGEGQEGSRDGLRLGLGGGVAGSVLVATPGSVHSTFRFIGLGLGWRGVGLGLG